MKRFKVTGQLIRIEGDSIVVSAEEKEFFIRVSDVRKSNVIYDFEAGKHKKKNKE